MALGQSIELGAVAHAAVDGRRANTGALGEPVRLLLHLLSKLAGRAEHEDLESLTGGQGFESGNHERARLPSTGLRDADDVGAVHGRRNGLDLDRGGLCPSEGFDRREAKVGQP